MKIKYCCYCGEKTKTVKTGKNEYYAICPKCCKYVGQTDKENKRDSK